MTERDIRWENVYAEIFDVNRGMPPEKLVYPEGFKIIRIEIVSAEGDRLYQQALLDPKIVATAHYPDWIFSMILHKMVESIDKALDEGPPNTEEQYGL